MKKNSQAKIVLNIIWSIFLVITLIALAFSFRYQNLSHYRNLFFGALVIVSCLLGAFNHSLNKTGKQKKSFWYYISTDLILLVIVIAVFYFHVPHATAIGIFIIIIAVWVNYLISRKDAK